MADLTINDSWATAERTCFDQLKNYTRSKENANCFLGYLPDPPARSIWMFTSGGLGTAGKAETFWGSNACWSSISMAARIDSFWITREDAQKFAFLVLAMLKEKTGLHNVANVQWLRITNLPGEPDIVPVGDGRGMWQVEIPMEMVFSTETVFT